MSTLSSDNYRRPLNYNHRRPVVTLLPPQEVSKLVPYSGLILTVSLVVFFLVRYYAFEGFLLPRFYGNIYTKLDDNRKRGFINHHVAAAAKIIMLITGAYPFFSVLGGSALSMKHPFAGSKIVTLGDVLLVLNQVFIAMYVFELMFRAKLSPVAVAHHMGSVIIAAVAVAYSYNWKAHPDATLEFILCYLWGIFDVIAEFWPHVAIILLRMRPKDHEYLRKVFFSAMVVTFSGTVIETIVVLYFWGWAWDRWSLAFKVLTPILHCIFTAAQVWGARNFYLMWTDQKKKLRAKDITAELGQPLETTEPQLVRVDGEEEKQRTN